MHGGQLFHFLVAWPTSGTCLSARTGARFLLAMKSSAQMNKSRTWAKRLRSEKAVPMHSLGSNEATYGLREGGAGFHRNRPAAGKAKPTLSAGIVLRVRNAD